MLSVRVEGLDRRLVQLELLERRVNELTDVNQRLSDLSRLQQRVSDLEQSLTLTHADELPRTHVEDDSTANNLDVLNKQLNNLTARMTLAENRLMLQVPFIVCDREPGLASIA